MVITSRKQFTFCFTRATAAISWLVPSNFEHALQLRGVAVLPSRDKRPVTRQVKEARQSVLTALEPFSDSSLWRREEVRPVRDSLRQDLIDALFVANSDIELDWIGLIHEVQERSNCW